MRQACFARGRPTGPMRDTRRPPPSVRPSRPRARPRDGADPGRTDALSSGSAAVAGPAGGFGNLRHTGDIAEHDRPVRDRRAAARRLVPRPGFCPILMRPCTRKPPTLAVCLACLSSTSPRVIATPWYWNAVPAMDAAAELDCRMTQSSGVHTTVARSWPPATATTRPWSACSARSVRPRTGSAAATRGVMRRPTGRRGIRVPAAMPAPAARSRP